MAARDRSLHQRLGMHARRRRAYLVSQSLQETETDFESAAHNESSTDRTACADSAAMQAKPLDPLIEDRLNASADYFEQRVSTADSLSELASHLIGDQSSGHALFADFPEVECEMVSSSGRGTDATQPADPASVFSDFSDAPAEADVESPTTQQSSAAAQYAHADREQQAVSNPASAAGDAEFERHDISRIREWLNIDQSRIWMFVGDETTASMRFAERPGFVEMFRHRLRWELKRFPDSIVNAGIEHATAETMLKITRQGLQQGRADAVFVMPSPYDLPLIDKKPDHYATILADIAAEIRAAGSVPVFQTPPLPVGCEQSSILPQLAHQIDLIREVCLFNSISLIDHAEYWNEQPTCRGWQDAHSGALTEAGQSVLALLFLTELDLFDRNSPLCQRLQLAWNLPATPPIQTEAHKHSQ